SPATVSHVDDVVDDLKGDPECIGVLGKMLKDGGGCAADDAADSNRRGEERTRLTAINFTHAGQAHLTRSTAQIERLPARQTHLARRSRDLGDGCEHTLWLDALRACH